MKPFENRHIVAILWMLVGVTLVCVIAAKVSIERARMNDSYIVTPTPHTQHTLFTK